MDPITIAMGMAQFAPGILKLITGSDKVADVAGKVIGVAQAVTGTTTGAAALSALQADPTKVLEFQQAMGAQQIDLERMYLGDVQNARALQVAALAQDDLFSKRFVYYFSAVWSLFAMTYFAAVTFTDIPVSNQATASTVMGVLITSVVGGMFAYFYGTTRANKTKDDTIKNLSGG